jgi:cell division transport system permease protein
MANIQKSKPSYIYAIIGVSLVLFLLGTLGWLVINGRGLSRVFKEDVEVQVVLHDNTRPEAAARLKSILEAQGFVRSVTLTSKEDAAKDFEKEWGEKFSQLLDFNPLYSHIDFKLYSDYVNKDSLARIEKFVLQSNIVRQVDYPQGVVEQMNANFRKISIILGAISLLLVAVVIILIDNTVRLAMFSNRFIIKTMQMVGATRWFISRPFDQRAVLNGFLSGVIAVGGLWLVISFAENQMTELKALQEPMLLGGLMAGMIITGILISVASTHRSVVKYLKMHVDDLY